jgi:hypothetical protein
MLEQEECNHLTIVDERLKGEVELTFKYLNTLILDKDQQIQEEHQKSLIVGGAISPSPSLSTSSQYSSNPFASLNTSLAA